MTLGLDAYATAVQPEIGQFNGAQVLGFFRGTNLEATIESAEQGTDENRITIRGFRPITPMRRRFMAPCPGAIPHRRPQRARAPVLDQCAGPAAATSGVTRAIRAEGADTGGDDVELLRWRRSRHHDGWRVMTAYVPGITETDLKKIILALQQLAAGRSNAVGTVTLATGSATTVGD